jgi:hypothetical protein
LNPGELGRSEAELERQVAGELERLPTSRGVARARRSSGQCEAEIVAGQVRDLGQTASRCAEEIWAGERGGGKVMEPIEENTSN